MFAIFNYAIIVYSWLFIKEVCLTSKGLLKVVLTASQTAGKSLEEMEVVFGTVASLKVNRSHSPSDGQPRTIDEEQGKSP